VGKVVEGSGTDNVVSYYDTMDGGGEEANGLHREIRMAEITVGAYDEQVVAEFTMHTQL
jgi:hypothetical protein